MAARVDESHSLSPTSDVPYQPLTNRTSSSGSSGSSSGGRPRGLSRTADGRSISFRNPAAILTREDIIRSASTMKVLKPITNNRCRWNIPWLLFIWLVIAAPVWLVYAAGCSTAYYTTAGVFIWFDLLWFLAIVFTIHYLRKIRNGMNIDYRARYDPNQELIHMIILTIYKDPMEVIFRTVDSIAAQTEARRIVMVMAWESRTPDRDQRTKQMQDRYAGKFHAMLFPVHPFGLPHEIASKAANANWGLRHAIRAIFETGLNGAAPARNVNNYTVTTCDADTLFHPRYFEALSADYLDMLKKGDPWVHKTIWQAPLFYNWNLDQNSFITRITGLLRTTMMMGMLIPYNVNPMSCFSFSCDLAIRGGYWHPQIFMDDVGYLITMMIGSQSRVKMRALPVPVLSGPTSGATWIKDIHEWYIQVRRWGIGTADDFHYFCVKICRLPWYGAIVWGFGYFLYYGIILCCGSLFGVANLAHPYMCPDEDYSFLHHLTIGSYVPTPGAFLLGLAILQFAFYGCMFLLDMVWIRAILFIKEDISFVRNFVHFLMTGPSLIALSLVQLWSYHVLAFKGKRGACIHQLAGKATLGATVGGATGALGGTGTDAPGGPPAVGSSGRDDIKAPLTGNQVV